MAIVGSAEIIVRAITNRVKDDIQKSLRDVQPMMQREGENLGKSFSESFSKGSSSNLGKSFEDSLKRSNLSNIASGEGEKAGRALTDSAASEVDKGASMVERRAASAMERAGRGGGNGFLRGFLSSGFANAASKASEQFTQLLGVGNLLGPGIAGLIGLLGSVASGLFAMGAAASQAAGALAVIPGTISVAAQAFGVLKLAMSGVSKAVSAGFSQANTQVAKTATNTIGNARAIADARKALARAYTDAKTAEADATQRVAVAEQGVAAAQRETLAAQQSLNAARKEGVKELRDLAFQAEDAGLAEQQAGLDLQKARDELAKAQSLPPDDRGRQQAELAFKEADLNYREAKARNQDLAEQEKKAAKAGVDGTDAVVQAKKRINDAQKSQADAEKNLHDAQEARAKVALQNERSIQDAQIRLTRAIQDSHKATTQATKQVSAYQKALDKLSPPARAFVEHLVAMKSQFDKLKAAAGENLFPKLTKGVDEITTKLFPTLITQFRTTGGLLGSIGQQFAHTISTGEGLKNVQDILAGNNAIMKIFTTRTESGRSSIGNLTIVFTRMLKVIQPITMRFAQWVKSLILGAEKATDSGKEMNKLTNFFKKAGDTAAQLGRIVHNLFKALIILGGGASTAGHGLLDSFETATKKLDKFLLKLKDNGSLQKYFGTAAFNLRAVGRLFDKIFVQLVRLSNSKSIGNFAKGLEPAVKNFGDVGVALRDASPHLSKFIVQFSRLIKALTSSKQTGLFIDVLTKILKIFADLASSPGFQKFLGIAGVFFAVHRALAFALKPMKFFFSALIGGPINVLKQFAKMRDGVGRIGKAFDTLKSGGGFRKAMSQLGKSSDGAKKKLEEQMVTDKAKTDVLQKLQLQAEKTAGALDAVKLAGAPGQSAAKIAAEDAAASVPVTSGTGAAVTAGEKAAKGGLAAEAVVAEKSTGRFAGAVGKASGPLKGFAGIFGKLGGMFRIFGRGLFALVGGPLGIFLVVLPLIIKGFQALYKHSPQFRKFVNGIVDAIKPIIHFIGTVLLKVLDGFFGWVNNNLPKVGHVFGIVFHAVGDAAGHVIDFFKKNWPLLLGILLGPIGFIAGEIIKHWGDIKRGAHALWEKISDIAGWIAKKFRSLGNAIGDVVKGIRNKFNSFVDKARELRDFVVGKVVEFMSRRFDNFKHNIGVVVGFIVDRFNNFKHNMGVVRDWVVDKVNDLKNAWQSFQNKIGDVVSGIGNKFDDFKSKLSDLWSSIKGRVKDIKDKFGEIAGSVGNAFANLPSLAAKPINAFIKFLNKHLIGTLNKVTGKFGLKIDPIPTINGFEKGGWTGPGPANKVAGIVHADEHVINKKSRRAIEAAAPGVLDYMNKTGKVPGTGGLDLWPGHAPHFGVGKLKDLAGETIGGLANVGEKIAKEGLGKVLSAMVKGATGLMGSAGIKRGSFINDLFYGVLDRLAKVASRWGGKVGRQRDGSLADVGGYNGPPGGWVSPVRGHFPITQYANRGHSPPWSIDIGTPTGTPVEAVTRGRVITALDIGNRSYGRYIQIAHAKGIVSLYAHLSRMLVKVGEMVKTGQLIGYSGAYGHVTGPHLHFEVKPSFDSLLELKKHGVKLAAGGVAHATPGGVLSVIAEAGHNERVEPLDRDGFSKRDRAILDMIQQAISKRGGDTLIVNPSKGMDEMELAAAVARRMQFRRRPGG